MGMIVQPLIGKWSDRTWCRMGRRKPYLLVGAIVAVLVMLFLPNAGSLSFSSRLLLGLNGATHPPLQFHAAEIPVGTANIRRKSIIARF